MTVNYFALHIGLPRGENLYQIKKGNNGISRNLADKIVSKYPEISLPWLLTGEGNMFSDHSLAGMQIPFFPTDVAQIGQTETAEPEHEVLLPMLADCDLAMLYNGKAMSTTIPSGSVVFLKKITPDAIIPGLEYVVVCKKNVTLRIVRTAEHEDEWRLVATDRENFDDLFVKTADIEAVYRVVGVLDVKR